MSERERLREVAQPASKHDNALTEQQPLPIPRSIHRSSNHTNYLSKTTLDHKYNHIVNVEANTDDGLYKDIINVVCACVASLLARSRVLGA